MGTGPGLFFFLSPIFGPEPGNPRRRWARLLLTNHEAKAKKKKKLPGDLDPEDRK